MELLVYVVIKHFKESTYFKEEKYTEEMICSSEEIARDYCRNWTMDHKKRPWCRLICELKLNKPFAVKKIIAIYDWCGNELEIET